MTFNAIENKKGEHLVFEETSIMIMQQMPSPFLWTALTSLDVIQITNAPREEPVLCITEYRLSGIILTKCFVSKQQKYIRRDKFNTGTNISFHDTHEIAES